MLRASNGLIGFINFVTFLLSIPIFGGGIWLSSRATQTDCMRFLQWPLIVIGASILVISLMGFAGSCYRISWLLWLYLFAMFFVIATLFALVVFAYAVTAKGSGQPVLNRSYLDYSLSDYSGWLKDRVSDHYYWAKISSCLRAAKSCRNMGRYVGGVPESADMFYLRHLSPTESGCCKPPTSCEFIYVNETVWTSGGGMLAGDPDCVRWSNDQDQLCYSCDSCKAGVLANVKKNWRKVSVLNIVVLIVLVIVYVVGCAAFRNNRRLDNDEPCGVNRMTKSQPARIHF
ncbi:tetraspanin-3-like [Tasmannia lanceolata]|uniref:tetraspanin-3-like n=1 Tax=Tasmannia lanceolata TaxID=3420 RepID=UPI004064396C